MSEIESTPRESGGNRLEELEDYEPPRMVVLGSVAELTAGGPAGGGNDPQTASNL